MEPIHPLPPSYTHTRKTIWIFFLLSFNRNVIWQLFIIRNTRPMMKWNYYRKYAIRKKKLLFFFFKTKQKRTPCWSRPHFLNFPVFIFIFLKFPVLKNWRLKTHFFLIKKKKQNNFLASKFLGSLFFVVYDIKDIHLIHVGFFLINLFF